MTEPRHRPGDELTADQGVEQPGAQESDDATAEDANRIEQDSPTPDASGVALDDGYEAV